MPRYGTWGAAPHRWRIRNHGMRLCGSSDGRKKKGKAQGAPAMVLGNKLPTEAKLWCIWKSGPHNELDNCIMTQETNVFLHFYPCDKTSYY